MPPQLGAGEWSEIVPNRLASRLECTGIRIVRLGFSCEEIKFGSPTVVYKTIARFSKKKHSHFSIPAGSWTTGHDQ